MEQLCQ